MRPGAPSVGAVDPGPTSMWVMHVPWMHPWEQDRVAAVPAAQAMQPTPGSHELPAAARADGLCCGRKIRKCPPLQGMVWLPEHVLPFSRVHATALSRPAKHQPVPAACEAAMVRRASTVHRLLDRAGVCRQRTGRWRPSRHVSWEMPPSRATSALGGRYRSRLRCARQEQSMLLLWAGTSAQCTAPPRPCQLHALAVRCHLAGSTTVHRHMYPDVLQPVLC